MATKGRFVAKARSKRRTRAAASRRFAGRGARRRHSRSSGGSLGKFNLFGLDLMSGLVGGAGAVGSGLATNYAAKMLPWPAVQTGPGRLALRAGVTIAASLLAKKALPSKYANPLIGGAVVGLGIDVLQQFVLPNVPGLGVLSGYEPIEETLAALVANDPTALNGLIAVDGGSMRSFDMPGMYR